jgi:hypothetical protein
MSLCKFTDTNEKKFMKIGCEDLKVYGSASFPGTSTFNEIQLADGTITAPSLSFQAETNTGLYREAPSNPAITVNGVNVLDISGPCVRINRGGTSLLNPLDVRLQISQGQDVGNTIASFQGSGERVRIADQDLSTPNTPPSIQFLTGAGGDIKLNGKKAIELYDNGSGPTSSVICGTQTVLGATVTDGFLYVPVLSPGPPTGVPTNFLGQCPICIDTVAQILYAYCNGAWKTVALV